MCIIKIKLNPIISECFGMSRNDRETRQNTENNQNNPSTNEMSSNNNTDSLLHDFGAPPPYRMNNEDQPETTENSQRSNQNQSIVPKVSSNVICHWQDWQFFKATVVDFHRENLMYTVDWRDYDQSSRVQPFNLVALDKIPGFDKIKEFLDGSSFF